MSSIYNKIYTFKEFVDFFKSYKNIVNDYVSSVVGNDWYHTKNNTVVEYINTRRGVDGISMHDSSIDQNYIKFNDGKYIVIRYDSYKNSPSRFWKNGAVYLYPYKLLTESEKNKLRNDYDNVNLDELEDRVREIKERENPNNSDDSENSDDSYSGPDVWYRNPSVNCGLVHTGNFRIVKLDGISKGTQRFKSLVKMKPILEASKLRAAERTYVPGNKGYVEAFKSFHKGKVTQKRIKKKSKGKNKKKKNITRKLKKNKKTKENKKLNK